MAPSRLQERHRRALERHKAILRGDEPDPFEEIMRKYERKNQ